MEKLNKLSLPATIIIASLILGGFIFATQVIKQQSIERQQDRKYVADRKDNCYKIYEKERDRWDNVKDFQYSEVRDVCIISYTETKTEYSIEECEKYDKQAQYLARSIIRDVGSCEIETPFTKEF